MPSNQLQEPWAPKLPRRRLVNAIGPRDLYDPQAFGAFAALASVPISAVFMSRTGVMFREIGAQPPSMFAVRDAMIFALGIAVTRTLMAG